MTAQTDMVFRDRRDAGRQLAAALNQYRDAANTIVIALPRGGVVVGTEVARALRLPLDIVVPRKIGAPGNEEYAIGALCENGEPVWDAQAVHLTDASEDYLRDAVQRERAEAHRRLALYRAGRPPRNVRGKHVILVDDGIATGMTVRAATHTLRTEGAARITLAVPVASHEAVAQWFSPSRREGEIDGVGSPCTAPDNVLILHSPPDFAAVGQCYDSFDQTTDEEVIALLRSSSI